VLGGVTREMVGAACAPTDAKAPTRAGTSIKDNFFADMVSPEEWNDFAFSYFDKFKLIG
jgi:hypothetical protein